MEECRNCRKPLEGKYPYVYDPKTKNPAKWNWYGGFVCCEQCDHDASLELERSMPGHGGSQREIGQSAKESLRINWPKNK